MFGLADREKKNKVNLVWLMFWYNRTHTTTIGKKLQANEKLKRWLTNPNRNLNGTSQTRPPT